ncbi:MAG: signal peptidase II [Clostridia bacterium]|nr:signal peptidase II [Clostridia bacterium]
MKTAALALLLTLIDQAIKAVIRSAPVGHVFVRVGSLAEITHSTNTGAAFSLFSNHPSLVTGLSLLLMLALAFFVFGRMRLTLPARMAVSCLLAGGAGNLIDRMFFGQVTDYIRLLPIRFPVFNFADILITCSIALLIALMFAGKLETDTKEAKKSDGTNASRAKANGTKSGGNMR